MCDPLSIGLAVGGGLLSAGGMAAGHQQQSAFVSAQNRANQQAYEISKQAREAERQRQRRFEEQQHSRVSDQTDAMSADNFRNEAEARAQNFMDMLATSPQAVSPADALPGQSTSTRAVRDATARQASEAAAKSRDRIANMAQMLSYAPTFGERGRGIGDTADFVSTISGLRRGSLAVGHQEQTIPAADVRPGSTLFADILSGLGSMSMQAGASGVFGGGSSLAPRTAPKPVPRPMTLGG